MEFVNKQIKRGRTGKRRDREPSQPSYGAAAAPGPYNPRFATVVRQPSRVEQACGRKTQFEESLGVLADWVSSGCALEQWELAQHRLLFVASYLNRADDYAPIRGTTLIRLQDEARKKTPDTEAIRETWAELKLFMISI